MRIHVNGEAREVAPGQPLTELLAALGLPLPSLLVEHNGRALLRSEWDETRLAEGDCLEILRIAAGG